MNILSIQSHVAYGHVGNSAAVFALQRLGCEVWPVHTVQFSNHTGYGGWKGEVFSAGMIDEVIAGIAERGVLASCDGVLSGYVGSLETGAAILGAVGKVKAANPDAAYCCDPVIGNRTRGVFVRPGMAEFFRDRAVPAARIVTPNHFELDRLAGRDTADMAQVLVAIDALHASGPRAEFFVTSVDTNETPAGHVDVVASDGAARYLVRTPRLATAGNGAGDVIAALFLFHYLRSGAAAEALALAASSVFGLLRRTLAAGATELALIAAQDELVAPSELFVPQQIRVMAMHGPVAIDRLELGIAPYSWPFAQARRGEIDAHFATMRQAVPDLWNGRVFLMREFAVAGSVLRGTFFETGFADFMAWRDWGFPDRSVVNCFAMGALRSSDGAYLLGVMSAFTANAGKIYFPAGTPDPGDVRGETVDLLGSVLRELGEETGLATQEFSAAPDWTGIVAAGPRLALMKAIEARRPAEELRQAVLRHLAGEARPELADVRIVRSPADFDPAMPEFVTAYLSHVWAREAAGAPDVVQPPP